MYFIKNDLSASFAKRIQMILSRNSVTEPSTLFSCTDCIFFWVNGYWNELCSQNALFCRKHKLVSFYTTPARFSHESNKCKWHHKSQFLPSKNQIRKYWEKRYISFILNKSYECWNFYRDFILTWCLNKLGKYWNTFS